MYNPYTADLGRLRQQELIAAADRGRLARAARRGRRTTLRRPPRA